MEPAPYWDGVHVHLGVWAQQGCTDAEMACGIWLSTWEKPGRRGTSMEERLGYTWDSHKVTCPNCLEWMEKNLKRCKTCCRACGFDMCEPCMPHCTCGCILWSILFPQPRAFKTPPDQHKPDCARPSWEEILAKK